MRHAGYTLNTHIRIHWIDSETLTEANAGETLGSLDGIIVPGGFGGRGIEGMIVAVQYAREHHVPFFGICLGMQIAVIEFARHGGHSLMRTPASLTSCAATRSLTLCPVEQRHRQGRHAPSGAYPCRIQPGTTMARCYGTELISERHRHRYEFNNDYRDIMQAAGLTLSGLSPTAPWSRPWSCPTAPSSWAFSITPNSSPVPTAHTRSSAALSPPHWKRRRRAEHRTANGKR